MRSRLRAVCLPSVCGGKERTGCCLLFDLFFRDGALPVPCPELARGPWDPQLPLCLRCGKAAQSLGCLVGYSWGAEGGQGGGHGFLPAAQSLGCLVGYNWGGMKVAKVGGMASYQLLRAWAAWWGTTWGG